MIAEYAAATAIPAVTASGQCNYDPGRPFGPPKWIILHGTAGFQTAQQVAQFFQTGPHSTHYVIGRDGTVVQCVPEGDTAWGNAPTEPGHDPWWPTNPNWLTLSIEHVKPSVDNSDALTDAQAQASFALVRHLCDRWGIPRQRADANGGITGHFSIDPVSRARCPGPYPWDALFAALSQGAPSSMSTRDILLQHGWLDNQTLAITQAPNGYHFVGQPRDFVLANAWNPADMPLQEMQDFGGGLIRQITTYNVIHVQGTNTWLGQIGTEWVGTLADLNQANATLANLQRQLAAATAATPPPPSAKATALVTAITAALAAYQNA